MSNEFEMLKSQVIAVVGEANASVPEVRKVTPGAAFTVVERSLSESSDLPFEVREFRAIRELMSFISLVQDNVVSDSSAKHTDLLSISHPSSSAPHSLTASALLKAQLEWVLADERISEQAKPLLASAFLSEKNSPAYKYAVTRLNNLPKGSFPLEALTAAFGDGNSYIARRARAMLQRRDRKGRFAYQGGGMSALIARTNGEVQRLTGHTVSTSQDGKTIRMETPDGKLYDVPLKSGEFVKAVLNPTADGFSGIPAQYDSTDTLVPEATLKALDAPHGFRRDEAYKGEGVKYTDDAYDVVKHEPTEDGGKPTYEVSRRGEGGVFDSVNSWSDVQKAIETDEPTMDKEQNRKPMARLSDQDKEDMYDPNKNPLDVKHPSGTEPKQDSGEFEYTYPDNAYKLDTTVDYEPDGESVHGSNNFTDDPTKLAQKFAGKENGKQIVATALKSALLPRKDGSSASGFGDLPFEFNEPIAAEALYKTLEAMKIDAKKFVAKVYDGALGEGVTTNQDELAASKEAKKAELPTTEAPAVATDEPKPAEIAKEISSAELTDAEIKAMMDGEGISDSTDIAGDAPQEIKPKSAPAETLPEIGNGWTVSSATSNTGATYSGYEKTVGGHRFFFHNYGGTSETYTYATLDDKNRFKESLYGVKYLSYLDTSTSTNDSAEFDKISSIVSQNNQDGIRINLKSMLESNGFDQSIIDSVSSGSPEDIINAVKASDAYAKLNEGSQKYINSTAYNTSANNKKYYVAFENLNDRLNNLQENIDVSQYQEKPVEVPEPVIEAPVGADAPLAATNAVKTVVKASDLKPGDITYQFEDPKYSSKYISEGFTNYFVVEKTYVDENTPAGKVSVDGYFPGHETQRKEWNTDTPISIIQNDVVPTKGTEPALHRPNLKKDEKYQTPEGKAEYGKDMTAYFDAKKASASLYSDPVGDYVGDNPSSTPEAITPKKVSKPKKPDVPAFQGEKLVDLVYQADGDPAKLKELLNGTEVTYFDYETSANSWDPTEIQPIQIAAHKIKDGEVVDSFTSFVNPGEPLGDFYYTTDENGNKVLKGDLKTSDGQPVDDAFLSTQESPEDVTKKFLEWLGADAILAGHNLGGFDEPILRQQALNAGVEYNVAGFLDTLSLARSVIPNTGKGSHTLGALTNRYEVNLDNWHDASADSMAVKGVLDGLLDEMASKNLGQDQMNVDQKTKEYQTSLENYATQLDAYNQSKIEAVVDEGLHGKDVPSVDELTQPVSSPEGIVNNPDEVAPANLVTPEPSMDSTEWVLDDNNTTLLPDKISPEDFIVGDFIQLKSGNFTEILSIEDNPEDAKRFIIKTRLVGTDNVYENSWIKYNKGYTIRRPNATADVTEVEDPKTDPNSYDIAYDTTDWKLLKGLGGSNGAALYEDASGARYVVKHPKSETHAYNEALASALYTALGINNGGAYLGKDDQGDIVLVSPFLEGSTNDFQSQMKSNPDVRLAAQQGFAADAWLNNWDSVGLAFDNILMLDGQPYRIDAGGALLYRAQGGDKKADFTPEVTAIDSLRDSKFNPQAASVFGSMTDSQIADSVEIVKNLSPEKISELVDNYFANDKATAEFLKERLLARREDLIKRFGKPEAKPEISTPAEAPVHSADTVMIDPAGDVQQQLQDAIDSGSKVAFLYNDKERLGVPEKIYTNPKNGNVNVTVTDDNGETKTFTISNIEKSKGTQEEPAPAPFEPPAPAEVEDNPIADIVDDIMSGATDVVPSVDEIVQDIVSDTPKPGEVTNPNLIIKAIKKKYPDHIVRANGDIIVRRKEMTINGVSYTFDTVMTRNQDETFSVYIRETNNATGKTRSFRRKRRTHSDTAINNQLVIVNKTIDNHSNPTKWMTKNGATEESTAPIAPAETIKDVADSLESPSFPKTGDTMVDALLTIVENAANEEGGIDKVLASLDNFPGVSKELSDKVSEIVSSIIIKKNASAPKETEELPDGTVLVKKPHVSADGKTSVAVGDKVVYTKDGKVGVVTALVEGHITDAGGSSYAYSDYAWVQFPGDKKPKKRNAKFLSIQTEGSTPEAPVAVEATPEAPKPQPSVDTVIPSTPQPLAFKPVGDSKDYGIVSVDGKDIVVATSFSVEMKMPFLWKEHAKTPMSQLEVGSAFIGWNVESDRWSFSTVIASKDNSLGGKTLTVARLNNDGNLESMDINTEPGFDASVAYYTPKNDGNGGIDLPEEPTDGPTSPAEVADFVDALSTEIKADPATAEKIDTKAMDAAVDSVIKADEASKVGAPTAPTTEKAVDPAWVSSHLPEYTPVYWLNNSDIAPGDVVNVSGKPAVVVGESEAANSWGNGLKFPIVHLDSGEKEYYYVGGPDNLVDSLQRHKSIAPEDPFIELQKLTFSDVKDKKNFKGIKKLYGDELQVGDVIVRKGGSYPISYQILSLEETPFGYKNAIIRVISTNESSRGWGMKNGKISKERLYKNGLHGKGYNNVKRPTPEFIQKGKDKAKALKEPKKVTPKAVDGKIQTFGDKTEVMSLGLDKTSAQFLEYFGASDYSEYKTSMSGLFVKSSNEKYIMPGLVVSNEEGSTGITTSTNSDTNEVTVSWLSGPSAGSSETVKSNTLSSDSVFVTYEDAASVGADIDMTVPDKAKAKLDAIHEQKAKEAAEAAEKAAKKAAQEKLIKDNSVSGSGAESVTAPEGLDWTTDVFEGIPSVAHIAEQVHKDTAKASVGVQALVDSDSIEDNRIRIYRVQDEKGVWRTRVRFKLTNWASNEKATEMIADGTKKTDRLEFFRFDKQADGSLKRESVWNSNKIDGYNKGTTYQLDVTDASGASIGDVYIHRSNKGTDTPNFNQSAHSSGEALSYHNEVDIYLPDNATPEQIKLALEKAGVAEARPATKDDVRIMAENKIIALFSDKGDGSINYTGELRQMILEDAKKKYGLDGADIVPEIINNGDITFVMPDEVAQQLAIKTNATYFNHGWKAGNMPSNGKEKAKFLFDLLTSDGLRSTVERWASGVNVSGMSSSTDGYAVGANYVFTSKNDSPHGLFSFKGERLLRRLDFYANRGDNFGMKSKDKDILKEISSGYVYEVLFKGTISWADLAYIHVDSATRDLLIEMLNNAGINDFGGTPLEKIFKV